MKRSVCPRFRNSIWTGVVCVLIFVAFNPLVSPALPPGQASSAGTELDAKKVFAEALEAQKRGDMASAAAKYQELVRLHPEMTSARANLGIALAALERYDAAISQFEAALEQVPGNREIRFNLALAYYKKGDLPEASRQFKSLLADDPRNMRAIMLLSDSYMRLGGHDDEVVALLTPLERADPENLEIEWPLGVALLRAGKTREGLRRIEKVAQGKNVAAAYTLAAVAHVDLQELDLARHDLDEATRLNPRLPGLQTLDGVIRYNLGDFDGAIKAFRGAIGADPRDSQARLYLGRIFYTQRKLEDALRELERALQIDPGSYHARYELARVERAQGKLEDALSNLQRVEKQNPEWIAPHIELAPLYYRLNRPEEGAREKKLVDQLTEEQRQKKSKSHLINP
jgi:tetratricopeptide (TPR) repeat protein